MRKLRKKFSSLFQYSERTIASIETNDTSKERSDTQLVAAEKFKGVVLSRGLQAYLQQKDTEKKSKFDGANSGSKKKKNLCQSYSYIMSYYCMPIAFELQQGSLWIFTKLPNRVDHLPHTQYVTQILT